MKWLNEYQAETLNTWSGDYRKERSILGILGEGGEVAECHKKYLRGDYDYKVFKDRLKGELGDVLYYVAVCAYEHDIMLSDLAQFNISKLKSRKERGIIQGDGSHR